MFTKEEIAKKVNKYTHEYIKPFFSNRFLSFLNI